MCSNLVWKFAWLHIVHWVGLLVVAVALTVSLAEWYAKRLYKKKKF